MNEKKAEIEKTKAKTSAVTPVLMIMRSRAMRRRAMSAARSTPSDQDVEASMVRTAVVAISVPAIPITSPGSRCMMSIMPDEVV